MIRLKYQRLSRKICHGFFIRGQFELPTEFAVSLPPLTISPVLRHNLFLAFKEALNNVVKHAQASEVQIAVSLEDERLTIIIEDDGRDLAHRLLYRGDLLEAMA